MNAAAPYFQGPAVRRKKKPSRKGGLNRRADFWQDRWSVINRRCSRRFCDACNECGGMGALWSRVQRYADCRALRDGRVAAGIGTQGVGSDGLRTPGVVPLTGTAKISACLEFLAGLQAAGLTSPRHRLDLMLISHTVTALPRSRWRERGSLRRDDRCWPTRRRGCRAAASRFGHLQK